MIELSLPALRPQVSVLLLGAHCDDIEIGMGATILRLVRSYPDAQFIWVTLSSDEVRERETRAAAEKFLAGARNKTVMVESFRVMLTLRSVAHITPAPTYTWASPSAAPDPVATRAVGRPLPHRTPIVL